MRGWAVAGKLPAREDNHLHSSLAKPQRLRGQLQPHLLAHPPPQPQRKLRATLRRSRQHLNRRRPAHANTRTRFKARPPFVSALPKAR